MSEYPVSERLLTLRNDIAAIRNFLESLDEAGLTICTDDGSSWFPANKSIERIIYDHFEIDQAELERERRTMLDKVREANK